MSGTRANTFFLPYSFPQPKISKNFDSWSKGNVKNIAIWSYPKVDRNAGKKSKKEKLPGKSKIYTDTPEKRSEKIHIEKDARAREKTKSKRWSAWYQCNN